MSQAIFLLGAAQGVFLAAVLASSRRNSVPNRLLAAVMLAFSVDLAMAVYHESGTAARIPELIGIDLPLAFLYGPLIYLYVRSVTEPGHTLRRSDLLHFIPFVLAVGYFLPFFASAGEEKLAVLADPTLDARMTALPALTPLKLGHGLAYVTAVVVRLQRHGRRVRDTYSSTDRLTLAWLRNLTIGAVALMAVSLVAYALGAPDARPIIGMDPTASTDDLTLLALTIFVYSIGYIGLRQPEVFSPPAAPAPEAVRVAHPVRYARSGMDSETSSLIEERLASVMDAEKPYRRGDLTLDDLAGILGVSPHNLTEVINTRLGQNFYDFVNGHRVRDVQARLAEPEADRYTLLAIAMDAGFNSKSAFNAAFKRQTGMTPSEYRRSSASEPA